MANYTTWIATHYPTSDSALHQCRKAATDMVSAFPELKLQVGFLNRQMHCWCITQELIIIDPTAHQFHFHIKYDDYKYVADYLLRKDQVEPEHCIVHLDDGRTVIAC